MVVYFTGTGNSRYAAEALAYRLGDKLISANEYIKADKTAQLSSDEPFVFVSPTYSWRIPRIFSEFIERAELSGSRSVYFVMSCGDDIGRPEKYLRELCEKKKLSYRGVQAVVMPENYAAVFAVTEKDEIPKILSDADLRLKSIAAYIKDGTDFPVDKTGFLAGFKSSAINPIFYKCVVKAKGFRVTDKCISCGRCETLCPLNNIKLADGLPVYGDSCTHCMACICGCPTEAIEYNKRTVGKARYFNRLSPEIEDS